jgi:hypothetical protein
VIANLDPALERRPPPEDPLPLLQSFPPGLVTQEVAAVMARGNEVPDRARAEEALIDATGAGLVARTPLADDALWRASD